MKINGTLLRVFFIVFVTIYCVIADSEEVGTKLLLESKGDDVGVSQTLDSVKKEGQDSNLNEVDLSKELDSRKVVEVSNTLDPVKKSQDSNLNEVHLSKRLESRKVVGENEESKANANGRKDEQNEIKGSVSGSKKDAEEGKLSILREKCDSLSNSCTDDAKNLVACLRVPGNESPDLSLLIQNKGKDPFTVTILAPDSVQLEKSQVELKGKEDTEVKVSINGVESGHFIILTVGHGNCSLDFRNQFVGRKKVDDTPESTIVNLSNQTRFLYLAVLLIVLVLILTLINFLRRYFARGTPKYQKLDLELPVSHGSGLEQSTTNEGWDNSWGDNWDDEEAPKTPSFPISPSLSSIGIASRKFTKDAWKD